MTRAGIRIPATASVISRPSQAEKSPWMISGSTRESESARVPESRSRFAFATENLAARAITAPGSCLSPSRMSRIDRHLQPPADRDHRGGRIAVADGEGEADGGPEGVADHDGLGDPETVEDLFHPPGVGGHVPLARSFGLAVAGQVDGDDVIRRLQGGVLLYPVRVVGAGAVDEDQRPAAGQRASVVHPAGDPAPAAFLEMDHVRLPPFRFYDYHNRAALCN